jgi:hypothetical protein
MDPRQTVCAGESMDERFFRVTTLAGALHFVDLHDWDTWEPSRIAYRDEAEVRWLVRAGAGERRIIRTAAELGAAIDDSASPRSIYLYVHESVLDEARSRWETTRLNRGRALFRTDRPLDNKE